MMEPDVTADIDDLISGVQQKIFQWIGVTTFIGIGLDVLYAIVLTPTLSGTPSIIMYALGIMSIPTALMIFWHSIMIRSRFGRVKSFLEDDPDSKENAASALKIILNFPIDMPLFGFLCWVVGGLFAVFGGIVGSDFMPAWIEMILIYIGILTGAGVIWLFQFYLFRWVLSPLVEAVIHKDPQVLDQHDENGYRIPLRWSLLGTILALIILTLLFSTLAGYRQASDNLQSFIGKSYLAELESIAAGVEFYDLTDPIDLEQAVEICRASILEGERNIYLIDEGDMQTNLLGGKLPFPQVSLEVIKNGAEKSPVHTDALYNPFGLSEIQAYKRIDIEKDGETRSFFLIAGYPWKNYRHHLNRLVWVFAILFGVLILIASVTAIVTAREISSSVAKLSCYTGDVAQGIIREDVFYNVNDEIGDLALSLRSMGRNLREIILRLKDAAENMEQATTAIAEAAQTVDDGARKQNQSVDEAFNSMIEMNQSLQEIASNVETLSNAAEESSSSVFEMSASIGRIDESVESLNRSINESSTSINEMTAALNQVADNISNLSAVAEETASSMSQMDASIHEIENHTKETSSISEKVMVEADAGARSVTRTTESMHNIEKVIQHAQEVINRLGTRGEEIGKVVQVIDEVSTQTNLLALNAAIIAAQAGQHGRSFSVVADEIKALSERTAGSIREITQLVQGVQEESRQAVGAISEGSKSAADGVDLSDQASRALNKILESIRQAVQRIQEIARNTVEQTTSSRQVSQAIEQVADMVNQISVATQEQSRGGSLILKATEEMRNSSLLVKRTTEEQLKGARLITKSIENITDMANNINMSQKAQKNASEQVIKLMQGIKDISDGSVTSAQKLGEVIGKLKAQSLALREEVKRFKV